MENSNMDVPVQLEDIAIEELADTAGAGTAFCVGSAGCPSSAGTASSFG
ncbi:thiocillin family RiPP [Streptomyces sp. NBC_00322]|nr:thiocillin family RiPP [Streptomyces sp. NBC_00322]